MLIAILTSIMIALGGQVADGGIKEGIQGYTPSAEVMEARRAFQDDKFGVFIHWGIYSMLAEGECIMHEKGIPYSEYSQLAGGFYPSRFSAEEWVGSIKAAGAKYITITSRHVDGYLDFICAQLTELLTGYGPVGCIWLDCDWDHIAKPAPGEDVKVDFDWHYDRIYSLIHSLQPGCMIGNNHHRVSIPGEDIQIFERDVPGENAAGFSRTSFVNRELPLETCQTMNRSWGYNITDTEFKSADELVRLLVRTAGRNANLLLNVGPQPDGRIPAASLERFEEIGEWLQTYGETIYGTRATMLKPQAWGVLTHKAGKVYVHVLDAPEDGVITLPFGLKPRSVRQFGTEKPVAFKKAKDSFTVAVPEDADCTRDYIVEIELKD